MRERILTELERIEQQHQVRVLLAVESGSRAWGFESPDSDWDVRFIYAHPRDWYLSVQDQRDVIEEMWREEGLDISGWELRKALRLFAKSNPPLLEWLHSPITYREDKAVMDRWRGMVPTFCAPDRCWHHYLHMAEGNYREYLRGDEVWLKKYLYVLRPVLACRWLEQKDAWVPVEFEVLVRETVNDPSLIKAIDHLLEQKMAGNELATGPAIPEISQFLDDEIERLRLAAVPDKATPDWPVLNQFFRSVIE